MKKILLLLPFIYFSIHCYSQAGQLDPLFDRDGIQTASFLKGNVLSESGQKLLQLADGKLLAVISLSYSQGVIGRYLSNGSLDVSYGSGGFTSIMDVGFTDAVLQPDGKLVAAGNAYKIDGDYGVVRFKTNGQPDSSFGSNGIQITDFGFYEQASGIAIQSNGKIVVVGSAGGDFGVVRYNTNGSLDNTFSSDGKQLTNFGFYDEAHGVAIQSDGKIVVTGTAAGNDRGEFVDFGLARYNTNGALDNTFSGDGKQTTNFGFDDYGDAVAIQTDGKIVVAGTAFVNDDIPSKGNFAVARYTTNGSPDNTFSGDGKQTTDLYGNHDAAFAIALQTDGKLLVAGITADAGPNFNYGLVRYNTNGNLDLTFSGDGKQRQDFGAYDAAYSVLLQADGKILLAGELFIDTDYDLGLIRYTTNGTLDPAFSTDGLVISFLPSDAPVVFTCAAVQSDGKLVAAGFVQHKISGSPGNMDFAIARYLPNGLPDNSFDFNGKLTTNFGSNDVAFAVAIQSNGKIVVAGGSNGRFVVARYNPDGSFDNTFDGDGKVITDMGPYGYASSIAIQTDGRIVVAGGILNPVSGSDFAVGRYNINGSLDNTFSGDGKLTTNFGAEDWPNALAIQKDGKILAVGSSQDSSLTTYFALARYNTNGTPDLSFSGDGRTSKNFLLGWQDDGQSVALQGDGKILVAGALRTEETTSFLVARYKTDGNLDPTYSGDGILYFDFPAYGEAKSIVVQPDGKSIVGGFGNGSEFALARVRTDGTLDPTFGTGGKQSTSIPLNPAYIFQLVLSGHRVYAAGGYPYYGIQGVTAAYQLGTFAVTLTCPSSRTVPPDAGTCAATVKTIDPVVSPASGAFTIKYSLTGATTASGTGTASNKLFNKGKTTVTYTMAQASEKTCNFTVTINCPASVQGLKLSEKDFNGTSRLMVSVLPNPASTYFNLNTKSNVNGLVHLRVTNILGILVEQRNNIAANSSIAIGHQYRSGVYYIQVIQGKEVITVRCIKQEK